MWWQRQPVSCSQKLAISQSSTAAPTTLLLFLSPAFSRILARTKVLYFPHHLHLTKDITTRLLQQLVTGISRQLHSSVRVHKMVIQHNVKGYEEFTKLMEDLENKGDPIHVLFSGGKDEKGESWCPYCVKAEPVIHEALEKAAEKSHFIHVDVGERTYWKDLNCPFRKDPNTHLVFLPTLLRWKSPQRLDGERCSNKDLVEMMFEDED